MEPAWHTLSVERALEEAHASAAGLSAAEAARRLATHGANALPEAPGESLAIVFLQQFQSPLIYLLLAAAAAVLTLGEVTDGAIIAVVLLFNAVVGTVQEGRAQRSLHALRSLVHTNATVLRDGAEVLIPSEQVVPGDVLILDEGARVPADARIIVSRALKANESSLTGESVPVHKTADAMHAVHAPVSERHDMLWNGTTIAAGRGQALVVATGVHTEIGRLASRLSALDTEVPLKADIRFLSRIIIGVVACIALCIFALGIWEGDTPLQMFATVVSLSVSVIPEGLPIVLVLVLATGVARMSKRNVLVKKLQAVEALGQARVIAVDKTGTITRNELVISSVYAGGKRFAIGGTGYEPQGQIALAGSAIDAASYPDLLACGKVAALCAGARPLFSSESNEWRVVGDPTEAAMFVFAQKTGFHRDTLEGAEPLLAEIPFDYTLKYHAAVHRAADARTLYVVGAPEEVLALSGHVLRDGAHHPLSPAERETLESTFLDMSAKGLRVVACAMRTHAPETLDPEAVHGLTFVGFLGMQDAIRPEVHEAMQRAHDAGIRVVMITGDHLITARAIAAEAGIFTSGDRTLTGHAIDGMDDERLSATLEGTTVFARVTPEHKLRIITGFKKRGLLVAMTGDGVNDAPSLVAADLGVAMGRIGTEVAKEAADLVLLDDNFGGIVAAVEEGRSIYKTIQKVILYLFSTSLGEVLSIGGGLALGMPLLLLPAQIIWLNFVTDGFLDVALAMEPHEKGLLAGGYTRPKRFLVTPLMAERMALMAIPMALGSIALFIAYLGDGPEKAWTVTLTVLAVFQWFNAWNCRSEYRSLFQMNPLSNRYIVGATLTILMLQLLVVYFPPLQHLLHTTALSFGEWLLIILVASSIIAVEEGRKVLHRLTQTA